MRKRQKAYPILILAIHLSCGFTVETKPAIALAFFVPSSSPWSCKPESKRPPSVPFSSHRWQPRQGQRSNANNARETDKKLLASNKGIDSANQNGLNQVDNDSEGLGEEELRWWNPQDEAEIEADVLEMLLPEHAPLPQPEPAQPVSNVTLENLGSLTESSDIAYFYLQNELGLSEEAMLKITFESVSILGMRGSTLKRKVELLRRAMDLTDDDVRLLLERHPFVLHLSADGNLAPTILFFVRALDLSKQDLRTLVLQQPAILTYAFPNLKNKLNFFTQLLGFSQDQVRELVLKEPKLLTAGVTTGLVPRARFLLREMNIDIESFRSIVQKNPRILLYSLDDNLRPKLIFYFIMTLHMEPSHVKRLLLKYPQILDYNLENHIVPISQYFIRDLSFSPFEVRNILLKCPRVVTHSLTKIKHVVGYFRFELGMEAEQVKRVLYQAPQVLNLNTQNTLKNKVQHLRDALSLDDDELRLVIAGMPTLTLCGIESNLQPKLNYLLEAFDNDKAELKQAVLLLPTLLGYSLEKRIRPRMEQLLAIGGHASGITIGIPMKEDKFDSWIRARQIRLERNPGFDVAKRKQREEPDVVAIAPTPLEKSGRIVHWTRERRPTS